jgi:alkylation response protein AidB-like acyl-CoA dehydrogenase
MDFELNDDQQALVASLESIRRRYAELPIAHKRDRSYFAADLQALLQDGGYFDAAREIGGLEAALVVIEIARSPCVVETGASALVVPHIPEIEVAGPFAMIVGDVMRAQRFLPVARHTLIDSGDGLLLLEIDPDSVEPVDTIFAYPYGRFRTSPSLAGARQLDRGARSALRHWWRVALAAEIAGAAQAAVAFTVNYVKERHVFGRAVGSFQAVQHRLAQCYQIARGIRFLALSAAWSGSIHDADLAAAYAQEHISKLIFDLHQFNGGMGVTNEHELHFWTYRLRALQAEMGGADRAALDIAEHLWGPAAA